MVWMIPITITQWGLEKPTNIPWGHHQRQIIISWLQNLGGFTSGPSQPYGRKIGIIPCKKGGKKESMIESTNQRRVIHSSSGGGIV